MAVWDGSTVVEKMTEEEAKEKWCPFVRPKASDSNRSTAVGSYHYRCIGKDCMAWRWYLTRGETQGYCGLAGKPF